MKHLGVKSAASTFDFKFNTQSSTGAPTSLLDAGVVVYKANNTTESASGITLTTNFDSRTGCNHVRIDTSSNSSFYATDNDFQAVLASGTVSGVNVAGTVLAEFRLGNNPANLVAIDGQATSGNNATLNLKQLNIVNSAGSAIIAQATGGQGFGIYAAGHGASHGIVGTGGTTGYGMFLIGGPNAGHGLKVQSIGGNFQGANFTGAGAGAGIASIATSGTALLLSSSNGVGFNITAGTHGLQILAGSSGNGINIVGGETGNGIRILGGSTSGDGIYSAAQGSGIGIHVVGVSNNPGMQAVGAGTGAGIKATAGVSGIDIDADITGNIYGSVNYIVSALNITENGQPIPISDNGFVDSNIAEISGSTLAADNLMHMSLGVVPGAVVDHASNTASTFQTDLTSSVADLYGNSSGGGSVLAFVNGVNKNQARRITSFVPATDFITVEEAFAAEPSGGDKFIILGRIEV